jgi:nucleoside-diphosphate-sugar epimerase
MRVFVTGATGFIGSAIVQELKGAGHEVLGLARSEAGEAALRQVGVAVHRGELTDLESLKRGALAADGVIHTAFIHDFSDWAGNCEKDRKAIEAIGEALQGSAKPFVLTSGLGLLAPGHLALETEESPFTVDKLPRVASELAATALANTGLKISIVRLPPTVHGKGDHGFVPALVGIAREKGSAAYLGDGLNHWSAVHRLDAARLFRLVLEKSPGAGARYHGAAEEGIAFKEIAAAIGRGLKVPVVSKKLEEAGSYFGWLAHFASIDNLASSVSTRQSLGWSPREAGLLEDLSEGHYFMKPGLD